MPPVRELRRRCLGVASEFFRAVFFWPVLLTLSLTVAAPQFHNLLPHTRFELEARVGIARTRRAIPHLSISLQLKHQRSIHSETKHYMYIFQAQELFSKSGVTSLRPFQNASFTLPLLELLLEVAVTFRGFRID